MKKTFKRITSVCLILVFMITLSIPAFAQENYQMNKKSNEQKTVLDIKKKYNPLRNSKEENMSIQNNELIDYNDENVEIVRVTRYDANGNIIEHYEGHEALQYLLNDESTSCEIHTYKDIMNSITVDYEDPNGEFDTQIVESFVESSAKSKVIRSKPLDVSLFDPTQFIFDAGLTFLKPVQSILYSVISQFLPASTDYKAGDVQQNQIYRFYQKAAELKKKTSGSKWFAPVIAQERRVDLTSSYYIVNDEGDLTKFYTDFGYVERNYNPLYDKPDSTLIILALAKWNEPPYNRVYSWDARLWPKDAKTTTYNRTPVSVITR